MHALEYDRVLETAREIRRAAPEAFILVGGHAAAAFPGPLEAPEVDAICVDDGEEVVPAVADALAAGRPLTEVPALLLRTRDGWISTRALEDRTGLDAVPLPARDLVERDRSRYHCLLFKPVWLVETARGCPFRCNFCSVWQLYGRSFRERSIGAVVDDIERVGDAVFIADDLFWNHPERSRELAHALKARGVTEALDPRPDADGSRLPARRPARGLAPAREGLRHLLRPRGRLRRGARERRRRTPASSASIEAARISRSLGYGVTGQLPRRSRLGRGALPGALGLRRGTRLPARRLHDPDAASGHRALPEARPDPRGPALVQVRHAPRAVGAAARGGTVLRALRRDLAPLDPQHLRREEPGSSGCARSSRRRSRT